MPAASSTHTHMATRATSRRLAIHMAKWPHANSPAAPRQAPRGGRQSWALASTRAEHRARPLNTAEHWATSFAVSMSTSRPRQSTGLPSSLMPGSEHAACGTGPRSLPPPTFAAEGKKESETHNVRLKPAKQLECTYDCIHSVFLLFLTASARL